MAIPQVTCNADIELSYSTSPQAITLGATATGSPSSWRWEMLSVPYGSTADQGVNGNFVDGISTAQNPNVTITGSVDGGYVFQCIATNSDGASNPEEDLAACEQQVLVKTRWYQLYLPGDYSFNWGQYLIDKTIRVIESVLHLHETNVSNPHLVTKTQVSLGSVTNDDQLKRAAGDFNSFALKSTPVSADVLLLEDSADTFTKKKVAFSSFSSFSAAYTEETKIDDGSTTKILSYTPVLAKSSPSGYAIEVHRNGVKLKWVVGSPATVDEYQYTSVSKTVTYVSESASFYQFIYWTNG